VLINRSGLLTIIKLTLPRTDGTGTVVQPKDIGYQSLYVSQLPAVQAGQQIGYCKNWTVQTSIASGVPQNHIVLYGQEWLTITQTDTLTQNNYKTFVDPVMQETLLLSSADALAEAQRRLAMWKVQRKVFKYTRHAAPNA
jgi:hypothetical protein